MTNITLKIPKEEFQKVKQELTDMGFFEREEVNTLWSLTDGQTYAKLYPSGTLLLQGKDVERLRGHILSFLSLPNKVIVGCDESGKGDIFGPLVVCCAVIKPEYYKKVLELNFRDCKKMKDQEVIRKAKAYESFGEFKCITVQPYELNKMHEEMGNINRILDKLYKELLEEFKKKHPSAEFMIDAYSKRNPFGGWVIFEHKGEENPSVAVASVLARAKFLEWLKAHNLPKGSSSDSLSIAMDIYIRKPESAKKILKTFFL
ncbi:MAG: ribonuclease HIII [Aquificaceae bacterium]|nr:ribonuclease HIII [Aquificaceae bacterium]